MVEKIIYLDNAASARVYPAVVETMNKNLLENYGNPSSVHLLGEKALELINKVRKEIALEIGAKENEIIFTSSASESNNTVIFELNVKKILVSKIEHASIWEAAMDLKKNGFEIIEIPVDKEGFIDLLFLEKNAEKGCLVSVIHGNNEIGVLQDLKKIGEICKKKKAIFHTDCSQSFGKERINVREFGIDLLSASGHKIGASKGIGFLFAKDGVAIDSLIVGGGQEGGRRAGTENVPGIAGLGKALELIKKENLENVRNLRNYFMAELEKLGGKINGSREKRLANNVSVSLPGLNGELLVLRLSEKGIMCSTGSACDEKKEKESRVLKAIGLSDKEIEGTVRFSLGFDTTNKDIDYVLKVIKRL